MPNTSSPSTFPRSANVGGYPQLVKLGGGHVAQLLSIRTGTTSARLEVALGGTDGSFGPRRAIPGASGTVYPAMLAGDARGDLVVAWLAGDFAHRRLLASMRPPGGLFGKPQILARHTSGDTRPLTVAVGRQGDMVVAFASGGRLVARVRRHGHHWGVRQDLGPAAVAAENDVTPFIADSGRIVVAWYHVQLTEDGEGPGFTQVAVQAAGAARFHHAQLLERDARGFGSGGDVPGGAPAVVAASGAAPVVIFASTTSPAGWATLVRVAHPAGAAYSAARAISPAYPQVGQLAAAVGPRDVIVTWVGTSQPGILDDGIAYAAFVDPAKRRFGAPQQVSPAEFVNDPVPTYSPSARRWRVAWTGRPSSAATVVRESSQAPAGRQAQ